MDLAGRSISLPSDISRRKLPDLPDDPCHSSKMSRIWASLKQKLSLRPGRLARSQSRHDDSSSKSAVDAGGQRLTDVVTWRPAGIV